MFSINLMPQVTRVQTLDFGVAGVGLKFDNGLCYSCELMACLFNPFFLPGFLGFSLMNVGKGCFQQLGVGERCLNRS